MRTTARFLPLLTTLTVATISPAQDSPETLLTRRAGFETELLRQERHEDPLPEPPEALFSIVRYAGPKGELQAMLSRPTRPKSTPGDKYPAIVWITGGFPQGGIGSGAWEPSDPENDQSAKAYREAGLVIMYPTVRGSFSNPGPQEGFFGEVDDILAALEHLRSVEHVDPDRIYLGGHSTGGTLALLVAAATDRFRAVFAFGPAEDPAAYGQELAPYDVTDDEESRLRAPIHHLDLIRSPTFVIEGEEGNLDSLRALKRACKNDTVRFVEVDGTDHFEILGPANRVIAAKLAPLDSDRAPRLTAREIEAAVTALRVATQEADDLFSLGDARARGVDIDAPQTLRYTLLARRKTNLSAAGKAARKAGFEVGALEAETDEDGDSHYSLVLTRRLTPSELDTLFAASAAVAELEAAHEVYSLGWVIE